MMQTRGRVELYLCCSQDCKSSSPMALHCFAVDGCSVSLEQWDWEWLILISYCRVLTAAFFSTQHLSSKAFIQFPTFLCVLLKLKAIYSSINIYLHLNFVTVLHSHIDMQFYININYNKRPDWGAPQCVPLKAKQQRAECNLKGSGS